MDNADENTIELHGDEEIIEVIELNETEQSPGKLAMPAYIKLFYHQNVAYRKLELSDNKRTFKI